MIPGYASQIWPSTLAFTYKHTSRDGLKSLVSGAPFDSALSHVSLSMLLQNNTRRQTPLAVESGGFRCGGVHRLLS
jgi:hypothetical protein